MLHVEGDFVEHTFRDILSMDVLNHFQTIQCNNSYFKMASCG